MTKDKFSLKDFGKAAAALEQVKIRKKTPVMQWIEKHIDKIDDLQKRGASLRNIFLTVNNSAKFGVSYVTFQRYIQTVRKEKGSELYSPKLEKKTVTQAVAPVTPVTPPTDRNEGWACPECKNAPPTEFKDRTIFICTKCDTAYSVGDDHKISPVRFDG